jgi:hypothetical protein
MKTSCFCAMSTTSKTGEYCIGDASRIEVVSAIISAKAIAAGWSVEDGKLIAP